MPAMVMAKRFVVVLTAYAASLPLCSFQHLQVPENTGSGVRAFHSHRQPAGEVRHRFAQRLGRDRSGVHTNAVNGPPALHQQHAFSSAWPPAPLAKTLMFARARLSGRETAVRPLSRTKE